MEKAVDIETVQIAGPKISKMRRKRRRRGNRKESKGKE
jgi:hypothetical protein